MAKLMNEIELADWLGLSIMTIRRNRTAAPHRHPPFKKIGSAVRYDPDEVQKWLDSKTVNACQVEIPNPLQSNPPAGSRRGKRGAPNKTERVKRARNASGK